MPVNWYLFGLGATSLTQGVAILCCCYQLCLNSIPSNIRNNKLNPFTDRLKSHLLDSLQ